MSTVLPSELPSDFVRKFAPWSVSKINVAAQCPYRFYLQYTEKKKMGLPTTSAALVGRAIHTLMENNTKGFKPEVAKRLAIEMHNLTTNEIETVEGFLPAIAKFNSRMAAYQTRMSLGKLQPEQLWAIDFAGKPAKYWGKNVFLRGAVDLHATFLKRPYAFVLDHKTGKWKELNEYKWQFAAYKLLLRTHKPEVIKIQIGVNHLFTETIDMKQGLDDVRDVATMFSAFMKYVNEQTRAAYNHNITRRGPLCDWCDYKTICPAHAEHDGIKGK
jgi:CRISPR/Cas system-associated exonuclease Cas4 (RecB family)